MSALWRADAQPEDAGRPEAGVLLPMTAAQLDAVMAIEVAAYAFPWSRGNFIDSLAAGHPAQVLQGAGGALLGYYVAMVGVDEMHLLNITVAPHAQGRGHARVLLQALIARCRAQRAGSLWLEVRAGNDRARAMYRHFGFVEVGLRKGYYPAAFGRREDAVVMSLKPHAVGVEASHALD
ncbi:MAG: ribosomal protein S18-alanine N-acetyltransferase [Burkholderiales bacterium]|nr:ribosomal protein S18-alanine N-acetyltransferase [Burkholderiales bacterium]MDE2297961.1 ribosomal protein S18-alanine N-acetyltransferase [Burkholderiales bacterium]MDE2626131.1 ribosomal protein S18-alanine N-acetyltransferase [Burkholderiales bacterium]